MSLGFLVKIQISNQITNSSQLYKLLENQFSKSNLGCYLGSYLTLQDVGKVIPRLLQYYIMQQSW